MLLVADSGSTKCDWLLSQSGKEDGKFSTIGFNPYFRNTESIEAEIRNNEELCDVAPSIDQLYFYGAGINNKEMQDVLHSALQSIFINADLVVDHDLIGSVYATCGDNPGISCILGTGSNACYYDGTSVYQAVPSLSYILGDEASGSYFGKKLIAGYLYKELPAEIHKSFVAEFGLTKEEIFEAVYRKPNANVYLASYSKFLGKHKEHAWVGDMIFNGFNTFINTHIAKYENHQEVPVHFVGSLAVHFQDILRSACEVHGITVGKIIKKPVSNLLTYHWNELCQKQY
ncbi:N-acetylglucosamine kinase [Bacteroidia bacterium]|nr:N-acetylglucosamine kinase [Bacteroidia bacterium]